MKIISHHFLFPGFVAATLITAGCQSPHKSCCTMSANSVAVINGGAVVQVQGTNGFDWYLGNRSFTGTNVVSAVQTKASQTAMTPAAALTELEEGNARFVTGRPLLRNYPAQVKATAAGQYPFAVVLSCLDSRQPIEIVLDQGVGDIFSARVAGNVVDDDILGSLEFACKVSGAKLIAVIGHSNCGAIKGAIDDVQLGKLTGLLSQIKPAIDDVPPDVQPRTTKNYAFVNDVSEANVRLVMQEIRERSPILREMLDEGQIELVGGMYDLDTGKVEFFKK